MKQESIAHKEQYPNMKIQDTAKLISQSEFGGSCIVPEEGDILHWIMEKCEDENCQMVISIDGPCASGKTTLGKMLQEKYDCNLFHMDDFFLRPEQKTEERLKEVGGNVDYERFKEQILNHIDDPNGLEYDRYDCKTQTLAEKIKVPWKKLNIVEGSYSQHPYFGDAYNLRIFLEIDEQEQIDRIRKRNGETMLKRFREEWIPKEQAYFDQLQIKEKSDNHR